MSKIILYEDSNFKGNSTTISKSVTNLESLWNDKVSSLIVVSGDWKLYEHTDYNGNVWNVSETGGTNKGGRYPSFKNWGGTNDSISSIKQS